MTIKNDLELRLPEPFENWHSFIKHWSDLYEIQNKNIEPLYEENIKKNPTEETIERLYIWKKGGNLPSNLKRGIEKNYKAPLCGYLSSPPSHEHLEDRYLNYKDSQSGGMIWNIFYLNILSKNEKLNRELEFEYPIFDQHVYRAMCFIQSKDITELGNQAQEQNFEELDSQKRERVFIEYKKYREFYKGIEKNIDGYFKETDQYGRKIDRALFLFGKNIKEIPPFKRKQETL